MQLKKANAKEETQEFKIQTTYLQQCRDAYLECFASSKKAQSQTNQIESETGVN